MKKLSITLLISILLVIAVSGCQEETAAPTNDRQARLMGNENLRLQNVIKDKDAEIASLQAKIVDCTRKNSELQEQTMSTGVGFMEMMTNTSKRTLELQKENELLKARIKELENPIN